MFGAGEFDVWNWFFSKERNYDYMSLSSVPSKKQIVYSPKEPEILCVCVSFEIKRPSQCVPLSSMKCVRSGLTGVLSCMISCWLQCQNVTPGRLAGFGRGNET